MLCVVTTSLFLPVLRRSSVVWATPLVTQTASRDASSRNVLISSSPLGCSDVGWGVLDLKRPVSGTVAPHRTARSALCQEERGQDGARYRHKLTDRLTFDTVWTHRAMLSTI